MEDFKTTKHLAYMNKQLVEYEIDDLNSKSVRARMLGFIMYYGRNSGIKLVPQYWSVKLFNLIIKDREKFFQERKPT